MPRIRKYIESHWVIYAFQGIISLLFGAGMLFAGSDSVSSLIAICGITLLSLGIIETFNLLYRKHFGGSLTLSLILAIAEVIVALMLLLTKDYNMVWPLALLAIYTIGRGVLEIILSFTSITDYTDQFMWVVCGICGAIIGVVILNAGAFVDPTTFIKFFGSFMMIYGVTNLFYGIHNRNELAEQKQEQESRKRSRNILTKKLSTQSIKQKVKKTFKRKKG